METSTISANPFDVSQWPFERLRPVAADDQVVIKKHEKFLFVNLMNVITFFMSLNG